MANIEADNGLAVVLVDHGSKRAEANKMLEDFAVLYRCLARAADQIRP